jgi:hypothetical protein
LFHPLVPGRFGKFTKLVLSHPKLTKVTCTPGKKK